MAVQPYRENTMKITAVENGVIGVVRDATMEVGIPRDNSVTVFIRRTYPALYNHVVRNMNSITRSPNAKDYYSMRGGHFFLYRYVILFALILCFAFGIASIYVKPCAAVPFVLTVLYIVLSIYNIVIFIRNRPLINLPFAIEVPEGRLDGSVNQFFIVPINVQVLTGVIAVFVDPAVLFAALRRDNISVTEIKVMLYDRRYLTRSRFPKEIIVHLFLFLVMFFLAIVFVSVKVSKGN